LQVKLYETFACDSDSGEAFVIRKRYAPRRQVERRGWTAAGEAEIK
jgi:hypothetical protein